MNMFFLKKSLAKMWGKLFKRNPPEGALNVRVLCYHSVNPIYNDECDPIDLDLFSEHIKFIKKNYSLVSFKDVVEHVNTGKSLPKDAVLITFDDGYSDNYFFAYPILRQYNCPAVIFIVSSFIDGKCKLIDNDGWGAMDWEQIRSLSEDGLIEIGAHTQTHRILSSLNDQNSLVEVTDSINDIESHIDSVQAFAYPNGQASDISIAALSAVAASDVELSFTTLWRSWSYKSDKYLLNRIMTSGNDSVDTINSKLQGHYDYLYWLHVIKGIFVYLYSKKGIGLAYWHRSL
jgi:peptidoglycan/xylan/chitin deacetylase (PgdA/CDA1 family)